MAKVSEVDRGVIIQMRGYLDYYKYRCQFWVCRKWPSLPSPPYTALQKKYQDVFRLSKKLLFLLSDKVEEAWKQTSFGRRPQWIDSFTGVFLKYYKVYANYPPVVKDYAVEWQSNNVRVLWYLYNNYDIQGLGGSVLEKTTDWLDFYSLCNYKGELWVSLFTIDGIHLPAPWVILIK